MTTKTKKELMEMQVVQAEAIKILIEKIEDLEMIQNESANAAYKRTLKKKAFADQAIHSSCDAFFREDFFSYIAGDNGYAGGEYYPELSCKAKLPTPGNMSTTYEGEMWVQGTFHFLTDSAADLHLVCSHFADIGEDYYVFFQADWDGNTEQEWVVWTPNTEHYNK